MIITHFINNENVYEKLQTRLKKDVMKPFQTQIDLNNEILHAISVLLKKEITAEIVLTNDDVNNTTPPLISQKGQVPVKSMLLIKQCQREFKRGVERLDVPRS